MAYYLRGFCKSDEPVMVSDIVEFAATGGVDLQPQGEGPFEGLTAAALGYAADGPPLIVEFEREADAVKEEVDEFLEAVMELEPSDSRDRIIARLQNTRAIAAIQMPTSKVDDATYEAAGSLVEYFVERRAALIQADGEGFYDGAELILPLV